MKATMTTRTTQNRLDRNLSTIRGPVRRRRLLRADWSTGLRRTTAVPHVALTVVLLCVLGQGCGGEGQDSAGTTIATTIPQPATVASTTSTTSPPTTTTTSLPAPPTTSPATTTVDEPTTSHASAAPPSSEATQAVSPVPVADCVSTDIMTVGMPGPDAEVALLQTQLASLGFDPGKIDGYFGENTWRAAASSMSRHIDESSPSDFPEGVFTDEQSITEPVFSLLEIAC